jgi:precorrin-6B methylase 2
VDYGAGRKEQPRNKTEMEAGVTVHETVGTITRSSSKPAFWAVVLFRLIRAMRPTSCIELGTSVGISVAYQSAALILNQQGYLITLEGSPEIAKIATNNLASLGLNCCEVVVGRFQDTLKPVLSRVQVADFVFVDGHHDEDATLSYFEQVIPHCRENAVIVFDDISSYAGVRRAWTAIAKQHMGVSIDLGEIGLLVFEQCGAKHRFQFALK